MRNRGEFWPAVPDWQTAALEGRGVRIVPVRGIVGIHVVSGSVSKAIERLSIDLHGPRDIVRGERYALRLAPDRMLIVSSRVEGLAQGWSSEGYAVSDLTDGQVLIDVTGKSATDVIAEGTGYDLSSNGKPPQESCMILFAGMRLAISRRQDGFRLHIERPLATALWSWLEAAIATRG